jgi:hypothetical protein
MDVCLPPDSTRKQLVLVFAKYVDEHPETAQRDFVEIAWIAFNRAFPCTP